MGEAGDQPSLLNRYLKDGWKKSYVRHLVARQEWGGIARVSESLGNEAVSLEKFRMLIGVSEGEKATVEFQELGLPLPEGVAPEVIRQFPTPKKVIEAVGNASRKRMLQRLYPEYQYLCGFVHVSPIGRDLGVLLDPTHVAASLSTPTQRQYIGQQLIVEPAFRIDLLSVCQSCCEFVSLYPGDPHLAKTVTQAWDFVSRSSLLGKVVWNMHAKAQLGIKC